MKMSQFDITLPVEKAQRDDGKWVITGIAAGIEVDAQKDRATPELIEKFAQQISESPVPLKNWHAEKDITADLGEVVKAWITDELQLGVEIELDQDNPNSQYLWNKIEKGKQYGLSVHGHATDWSRDYDPSQGMVRTLKDVKLDEISITTRPAYTPSFGTVIRKSIEEAEQEETNLSENTEVSKEVTTPPETTEVAGTAEAPSAAVTEPVVEKAVTTDSKRDEKKLAALAASLKKANELIAELGLDATSTTTPSETVETVEKSSDTTSAETIEKSLASLVDSNKALQAEIESLKALIPETQVPPVLVSKSKNEEIAEVLRNATPRDALRFGLAGMHGELK